MIPITGPQSLNTVEPRRISAAMTPSVASAVKCGPTVPVSDASGNRRGTTEARVMDSIISTVPPRVGVTIRRRTNSHLEMAI